MSSRPPLPGEIMNVTEDVVRDLLPLYFEGEASADSRAVIESWFARDPAFARAARRGADAIGALGQMEAAPLDEAGVREALKRMHRIARAREIALGLAGGLTLLPFLLGGLALLFPARMALDPRAGLSALLACFGLAALSWLAYFHVRRRTGSDLF
jgi:anti-sigma factor RsiW